MQSVKTMTTPLTDYQSACGTPTALGGGYFALIIK